MHIGICIVVILEIVFVMCVYEVGIVGWATERHCTVEGDGVVNITMHVVKNTRSGRVDRGDFLHMKMNATFRVDKHLFHLVNEPVRLRRLYDMLVGHSDTERERPIDLRVRWDMGDKDHHVMDETFKGSAYQICYEKAGHYYFEHPGDPDESLLAMGCLLGLLNVVGICMYCYHRERRY